MNAETLFSNRPFGIRPGDIVAEFDDLKDAGARQATLGADYYVSGGVSRCYAVRYQPAPSELLVAIDSDAIIVRMIEAFAQAGLELKHREGKPPLLRLRESASEKMRHEWLDKGSD